MIVHGGLIARRLGEHWRGVLIEGPSGAGKSDLALRALERGFSLVADDRVRLFVSGGRLYGRAPSALAGLIEARGIGVTRRPFVAFAARLSMVGRIACQVRRSPSSVSRIWLASGDRERLGVDPAVPGHLAARGLRPGQAGRRARTSWSRGPQQG